MSLDSAGMSLGSTEMNLDLAGLGRDGFCTVALNGLSYLKTIQENCERYTTLSPTLWHQESLTAADHLSKVKGLLAALLDLNLFIPLLKANLDAWIPLLGPDINIQRVPHLRISRPEKESDLINWHRDTFYGNTPWELNLWMPLYPLQAGAGLCIVPGSHRVPSQNVRVVKEDEPFRRSVTKGSVANQLGYVYQPKTDDLLASLTSTDSVLLRPDFGSAILFFGCCAHRAENRSQETRVSVDMRICSMHVKTACKPGYYQSLARGVVQEIAATFLGEPDPQRTDAI